MKPRMIAVVDGKGGGMGRAIIETLLSMGLQDTRIVALGTNSGATANMLAAGAHDGATGESAICHMADRVDLIVGPMAILASGAMMGEISARIAGALAQATAPKVVLPLRRCGITVVAPQALSMKDMLANLPRVIREEIEQLEM